ncbi:flagellar hook-associated protein FlgL [Clostridium sp. CF012]|uniref:flagellar hook-associated protein FlgL n=1 Tax=Clostridium sp. CF012 TaxID=2843319 RepID=UPI001C0B7253|nr:flagellar hook-associated protein FlgL [Clostridium sp. CF012]MBU3142349.1 flagellar hook-associated protein FlgL [Clostridium sp. CF012]
MRVTNKMLSNNFLRDMRTNLDNLRTLQNQTASGKQIRKASDDPFKASRIMQMHSEIDANKQYNSNIKDSTKWLDTTDAALGQAGKVVGRIEELLISVGDPGYNVDQRKAIKDEINEKIAEFSQIVNTTFDGKYIFGGTRGTTKPTDAIRVTTPTIPPTIPPTTTTNTQLIYSKNGGGTLDIINEPGKTEYDQIRSKLLVEVSQGVTMDYNTTAAEVINYGAGTNNLMDLFKNITSHLDSTVPGDVEKLTTTDLQGIKDSMTNILKLRTQAGAKQNRMESAENRNIEANFNMTEILSSVEDIDIAEKTMEYATMQTVYAASLQTSARVLMPSLLDYLR